MNTSLETGNPIAQVAKDLGINEVSLGNWVDAAWRRRGDGTKLGEDERAELARLRKENAELAMEAGATRGWAASSRAAGKLRACRLPPGPHRIPRRA